VLAIRGIAIGSTIGGYLRTRRPLLLLPLLLLLLLGAFLIGARTAPPLLPGATPVGATCTRDGSWSSVGWSGVCT
jgi:hypothetical protein